MKTNVLKRTMQKRGGNRLLVGAVLLTLILAFAITGCSSDDAAETSSTGSPDTEAASEAKPEAVDAKEIAEGESLTISVGEVSETATFYPVSVDGTTMEVLAVKAPDGTVRTAFNTCQVCFDSGRGYYEQSGDTLVCQNCGNRFAMSDVEIEAGGCNPWPIFAENKSETGEAIAISYDFLKESKDIFANWK
jgi:uncharacterized membrane protein